MNRGVNPLATVICSDWLYARINEAGARMWCLSLLRPT